MTSQMENAPFRTVLWRLFALSGLYYDPEHSFALAKSLYCIFFTSKSERSCEFAYVFIVLNFSKALEFCQTLFAISARSLLIFPLVFHLCQFLY